MTDFSNRCRTSKTNATVNFLLDRDSKKYNKTLEENHCKDVGFYDFKNCAKIVDLRSNVMKSVITDYTIQIISVIVIRFNIN